MERSSKQKINKETQVLNDTLHEMDLTDIFRTFHPNAEEYTFFSSAHGTFSRIDHILGHKSNLSKLKKTEIISSIFSDHNAMRLESTTRKKTIRNTNTWRLNNTFLNNQQVTEEIKREIKEFLETNDNEKTTIQNLSVQFSSVTQSCPTLSDPMDCITPGLPVHHQLPEFTQTHVHWVSDANQPSQPLSFPSPPTFNLSQHQGLF